MESDYLLELNYDIYLAEQEFYSNLVIFGSKIVNESCGLIILNEDFKDNIKNYISKIVKAVQGAWDKFATKIIQSPNRKYLQAIGPQVANYNGMVEVKNFPNLNNDNFRNLQLVKYSPDELNNFKNKDDIIKANYSNIPRADGESFKSACFNFMNNNKVTGVMNADDIRTVYEVAYKGLDNASKILENNLTEFNTTIKAIEANINVEVNAASPAPETNQEMASIFESYLMEADDKVEINVGAGGSSSGVNIAKSINSLISVNTDIISSKMKYLRTQYMWSIKLLKSLFKVDKNEKDNQNSKQEPQQDQIVVNVQTGRKAIGKEQ